MVKALRGKKVNVTLSKIPSGFKVTADDSRGNPVQRSKTFKDEKAAYVYAIMTTDKYNPAQRKITERFLARHSK